MIPAYAIANAMLVPLTGPLDQAVAGQPVWLDLFEPTPEERAGVERALGIVLPTHKEMQAIGESSRLYQDDGALFMTATVLYRTDTAAPEATQVTFMLTGEHLVTLRHAEPRSFPIYAQRAQKPGTGCHTAEMVMAGLLDTVSDRLADLLERLAKEIDGVSREIFTENGQRGGHSRNYRDVLRHLGRMGDALSKARETLVSQMRLLTFFAATPEGDKAGREARIHARALARDLQSLSEHAGFLADKIAFLLDAILGLVNIEQSGIIKIFSVVAAAFLPPTLIASIYGMNFELMPELSWPWGYPMALFLMLLSGVLPCLYFKRRGWL